MDDNLHKTSDHDLLIELRTEMRGMRNDLKELRDDSRDRIVTLEAQKIDKEEVNRLVAESSAIHGDFSERLKWLERIAYIALPILLAGMGIYVTVKK
jgi:hypothetical protein